MTPLVVYLAAHDPEHRQAWADVAQGRARIARVQTPGGHVLFEARRVSATSWCWRTSRMSAPAFAAYEVTA